MTYSLKTEDELMYRKVRTIAEIKSQQKCKRRKILRVVLRVLMSLLILAATLTAIFLGGCSTDDERDICCEGVRIRVRYVRDLVNGDEYQGYIKRSEHFWFDSEGILIAREEPKGKQIQYPSIDFSHGRYTLLVVGNRSEKTTLDYETGVTRLQDILMQLNSPREDEFFSNSDRLYWGILPFEVFKNKHADYICDMSNIHCRLRVTVKWKNNLPQDKGLYSLRLSHVPATYRMTLHGAVPKIRINPFPVEGVPALESSDKQVVHSFPMILSSPEVSCELQRPISSAKLNGEFVTFRYDDDFIPIFQVWKDDTPLMKAVDLSRFFKHMDWIPSGIPEQFFDLIFEIDPANDIVTVSVNGGLGVLDWQDGGTINQGV